MILTFEDDRTKLTIDVTDLDICDMTDRLTQLLTLMGYHPCSIQEGYQNQSEDINQLIESINQRDQLI